MPKSRRPRRSVALLLALGALYAAVFGLWGWKARGRGELRLAASRPEHRRFDIVELRLKADAPDVRRSFEERPPRVVVLRGGAPVTTIAGLRELTMAPAGPGAWTARWPVPWNAPEGEYLPALLDRADLDARLKTAAFRVARRAPHPLPPGFAVLTLESVAPLATMRVKGPDGKETDWRGLLDWTQWIGADAFWMLAGQTPGLAPGETWVRTNEAMIPLVAAECRKRGLKFGAYAMFSLTMSNAVKIPGYRYALEVKDGRPVETRAISLTDPRRVEDLAALLEGWAKDPNVDMVGVDYIRNALGGYELVDEFVAEMPGVRVPPEWARLSRDERVVWLARKKIMRKDEGFVDAWQWWRARKAAAVASAVKARIGGKPLWAFTLTWDKGWHHGQDPVMMSDAGVDYDALMFYEADKDQYAAMLKAWGSYVRRGDVQLVPGDIFDWGLHQKDPAGPAELGRRMRAALDRVYADGPARAVFFHDAARLLWGRLGPWGTRAWAEEARAVVRELKTQENKR